MAFINEPSRRKRATMKPRYVAAWVTLAVAFLVIETLALLDRSPGGDTPVVGFDPVRCWCTE